ncbi:MAG: hypothetical protein JSW27_12305 [Phycisphaerales bacterium]|nr:MAG: hypothetical protein JSW27_12305 [Phycisphaerales bacterium]
MHAAGRFGWYMTVVAIFFLAPMSPAVAKYSGGSGTLEDPYQIATAADLIALGESPEDYDQHFILTADIDLDPNLPRGRMFDRAVVAADTDPARSGFQGIAFTGVFDGNSHAISHLTMAGGTYLGLFGRLASGGKVENLAAVDVSITASGTRVGGLAGVNSGCITTSYSSGFVSGGESVGGLVGANSRGTVSHCYSGGSVMGDWAIGGLIGYSEKGSITSSYTNGSVSGGSEVGGLVGCNYGTAIERCYSTGTVHGTDWAVGGLVGSNGGSVLDCYSTCLSDGPESVGGLVGYSDGDVVSCYSTGMVTGTERTVGGLPEGNVGGLVGTNGGSVLRCHSTGTVSGVDRCVGGLVGTNWGSVLGCSSTSPSNGKESVGGLVGFNNGSVLHCHSAGMVTGIDWGIGGLVGSNSGRVLCCHSASPSNGKDSVGGLVGESSGYIARSYSSGTVCGTGWAIGGLVGNNEGSALNCYSTSSSDGKDSVGGLVGHNEGEVAYCYSTGIVRGTGGVGGLVAADDGAVTQCFWDIQTSGQATSPGGTGLTTAQMWMASVFEDAGWDFLGETANGMEDIWWIADGQDYPRLVRQFAAFSPDPCDGGAGIDQPVTLRWAPGASAVYHDIYLGEDKNAVAEATTESADVYCGRQPVERVTYEPGLLEMCRTYYWRIDEVDDTDPNGPWKGTVWRFTTADFIVVRIVDDFESYWWGDIRLYEVWLDGWINGTGSMVGYFEAPFVEWGIVHGGAASLPLFYDNDGTVDDGRPSDSNETPFYSECTRTWSKPQDWTIDGADTLTLYFHGRPDNAPDHLYMAVEDDAGRIATLRHPEADALLVEQWQEWSIALADIRATGVDLAAVQKICVGIGDRDNPQAGGAGLIYIDDIWLIKRLP